MLAAISEKTWKYVANKHGPAAVMLIFVLWFGYSTGATVVAWMAVRGDRLMEGHLKFLERTAAAVEQGAAANKQTADAVTEIRAALQQMRRDNDVGNR